MYTHKCYLSIIYRYDGLFGMFLGELFVLLLQPSGDKQVTKHEGTVGLDDVDGVKLHLRRCWTVFLTYALIDA
jgi:hypothetical protein